jgi:hypothetical protein
MAKADHILQPTTFERLREQVATAAALCDHKQLLTLADDLHDAIRRRRDHRHDDNAGSLERHLH